MQKTKVDILRGHQARSNADAVVVVDVLRAFSLAHHLFELGAKVIYPVSNLDDVEKLRSAISERVISIGEKEGRQIDGYDLGNSLVQSESFDINRAVIAHRTSNGTKVLLANSHVPNLFVTGLSNIPNLHRFLKDQSEWSSLDIICSHPTGDDDLVCAEYLKDLVLNKGRMTLEDVQNRVLESEAARKFLDDSKPEFPREDLTKCIALRDTGYIMRVSGNGRPTIERFFV